MKLDFLDYLFEAGEGPRIPHPEDSIFAGSAAATKAIGALKEIIARPGAGSIKWDGGIALYFGYDPTGKFFINDKYMPEGFYAHSPADWQRYDTEMKKSKVARTDLYPQLAAIWQGMQASVTEKSVFKGDLMWTGELQPVQGKFVFKPTTVEYRVPVDSSLGRLIAGKAGGIVVHQKDGAPWDGKSGLVNAGNVAILTPTAGITFSLKNPVRLVADAEKAVAQGGPLADKFLAGLDGVAREAIKTYMNKKITKQTQEDLPEWLMNYKISAKQKKALVGDNQGGYLYRDGRGLTALFAVWNAIYRLKDNLAQQLEPQVKGFEQWTGGQQAGEGFVFPTSQGLIKLVNRAGFGAAHFNK